MKKVYDVPEIEIIACVSESIITTSGLTDAGDADWGSTGKITWGDLR